MFFDDINGLVIEVSNMNAHVGYVSDELPLHTGEQQVFRANDKSLLAFESLNHSDKIEGTLCPVVKDNKISNPDLYFNFAQLLA